MVQSEVEITKQAETEWPLGWKTRQKVTREAKKEKKKKPRKGEGGGGLGKRLSFLLMTKMRPKNCLLDLAI